LPLPCGRPVDGQLPRESGGPPRTAARPTPQVVQERLGYAGFGITLDIYSPVAEGLHGDAANLVARLIAGSVRTPLANAGRGDND
jgi:hypothetical protein